MKRALLVVALLLSVACAFAAQAGDDGQIGGTGGGPVVTVEPFPSPLDSEDEGAFLQENDNTVDEEHDETDNNESDDKSNESEGESDGDETVDSNNDNTSDSQDNNGSQDNNDSQPQEEEKKEDQPAEASEAPKQDPSNDAQAEPADDMAANGVTREELADVDELNDEMADGATIPDADAPTVLRADGSPISFLSLEEDLREPPLPKHSFMDSTDNNAFNMPGIDPSQPTDESALIDLSVPRNAEEAEENDAYRFLSPDEKQVIEEELHDAHFNIIPKLLHERAQAQARLDAQFF